MPKTIYQQSGTNLEVVVPCRFCNEEYSVDMTYAQYKRLHMVQHGFGGMANELLSDFPAEVKRMLVSGRCPDCTNKMIHVVTLEGGESRGRQKQSSFE